MLTESQRKWLTEYIGECWHEPLQPDLYLHASRCKKCGLLIYGPAKNDFNRTFTTWADLGAVKEAIEQKGEWASFQTFASGEYSKDDSGQFFFTLWLFNPSRFCELVCAWKGVE